MMYYVSWHTGIDYRQCSTPGCRQIFIADPPSRRHCDKHIEHLRKKRENQRNARAAKEKTREKKEINEMQELLSNIIYDSGKLIVADNSERFEVCTPEGSSFTISIQKN